MKVTAGVFAVLVALCVSQVSCHRLPISRLSLFQPKESELINVIKAIVITTRERVTTVQSELDKAIESWHSRLQNESQERLKGLLDQINDAVNNANQHRVIVKMCLTQVDHIPLIVEQVVTEVNLCIMKEEMVMKRMEAEVAVILERANSIMAQAEKELSDCKTLGIIADQKCVQEKLTPLKTQAREVSTEMGVKAAEVHLAIRASTVNIEACAAKAVADTGIKAQEIVAETLICIEKKMNEIP